MKYKRQLPKLTDVENTIDNLSYSIKDVCIEYYNKGLQEERKRILKIMNKLVNKASGDIAYGELKQEIEKTEGKE